MANDLVVIQDEATTWGSTPYENMIAAAKAREARKQAVAMELQRAQQAEINRQNEILFQKWIDKRRERKNAENLEINITNQNPHPAPKMPPHTIARLIVRKIEEEYSIPPNHIWRRERKFPIVLARQIAMYEIHINFLDWSLPRIGMFFAGRDHTTVLHALRKINRLKREDETFAAKLSVLDAKVREIVRLNRQCVVDKGAPSVDSSVD